MHLCNTHKLMCGQLRNKWRCHRIENLMLMIIKISSKGIIIKCVRVCVCMYLIANEICEIFGELREPTSQISTEFSIGYHLYLKIKHSNSNFIDISEM